MHNVKGEGLSSPGLPAAGPSTRTQAGLLDHFQAWILDDDLALLEQSYRLRYQVYCLERQFLPAENYPDRLERDAFDQHSVHVGVVDAGGELAATARVIKRDGADLPLFRYCTLFPEATAALQQPGVNAAEASRISISRHYRRRRHDPPYGEPEQADDDTSAPNPRLARERRRRRAEPFRSLIRALIYGAKLAGATHLIGATDAALHRWLVHYGFPYRLAGPEVDYYGPVAPHIISLAELDQVIVGGQFAVLDDFPVGWDAALWHGLQPHGRTVGSSPDAHVPRSLVGRPTA